MTYPNFPLSILYPIDFFTTIPPPSISDKVGHKSELFSFITLLQSMNIHPPTHTPSSHPAFHSHHPSRYQKPVLKPIELPQEGKKFHKRIIKDKNTI